MQLFLILHPQRIRHHLFVAFAGALLAALILPAIAFSQAQPQKVTANIETPGASSNVRELVQMDGVLYFFANHLSHENTGLWRSDGTEEGTTLVREFGGWAHGLTVAGDLLVFNADDTDSLNQIWRSDGATEGTMVLLENPINPLSPDSVVEYRKWTYFFIGTHYSDERELWRIGEDGMSATKIIGGEGSTGPTQIVEAPVVWRDMLYFLGGERDNKYDLWRTDGTPNGFHLVKKGVIAQGDLNAMPSLTIAGDGLFFEGMNSGSHHQGLWYSDGTAEGTKVVGSGFVGDEIFTFQGNAYFALSDNAHGEEPWRSDGTVEETKLIDDIVPGLSGSSPSMFTQLDDVFVFRAWTDSNSLWRSDGTIQGTNKIFSFENSEISWSKAFGGVLYFIVSDYVENGPDLWRTDGTTAGTELVFDDLFQSRESFHFHTFNIEKIGDTYFFAREDKRGVELWKSENDFQDVSIVKDVNPDQEGMYISHFLRHQDQFYFEQRTDVGSLLWVSDGTPSGTKSLFPQLHSRVANISLALDTLYFIRAGEFWKTQGTPENTELIKIFTDGIGKLVSLYDKVFFEAVDGSGQAGLWVSDGTLQGSKLLKNNFDLQQPFVFKEHLYFSSAGNDSNTGIWRTDGTSNGTVRIDEVGWSQIGQTESYVLFTQPSTQYGRELWRYDGSDSAPVLLANIGADKINPWLRGTVSLGELSFFMAFDDVHGWELWRSDGSVDGTFMLGDIVPGVESSYTIAIAQTSNFFYFFSESDNSDETSLWKTDGTHNGTSMITTLKPTGFALPYVGAAIKGIVYFAAHDPEHGSELWQSDGTAAGTKMVFDLRPSTASSEPSNLIAHNDVLYFAAKSGTQGSHIWRYRPRGKENQFLPLIFIDRSALPK